jgi:pimeloyl-ACP methyl ester carboxylesterase
MRPKHAEEPCLSQRNKAWQAFMREHRPKTIIFWGEGDVFFTPEGGEAYLRDLPNAEMHRLEAGHFAVEDHVDYIADNIARFHAANVAKH